MLDEYNIGTLVERDYYNLLEIVITYLWFKYI